MNLPALFSGFKKEPEASQSARLILIFLPHHVLAAVWSETPGGKPEVHGMGKKPFESLDILTEAAGGAIDAAVEASGRDVEEVVFGVLDAWVEDGDLDTTYANRLRELSRELELKPIAFVPLVQALAHLLKIRESVPPTAILVGVDTQDVHVGIVQTGRIVGTASEQVHEHVGQAVENAIRAIGCRDHLPSRLLLFGGEHVHEIQEDLLAYPWLQRLPAFLHFPKLTLLSDRDLVDALVAAAGGETPQASRMEETQEKTSPFGFVRGKDIASEPEHALPEEHIVHTPAPRWSPLPNIHRPSIPSFVPAMFRRASANLSGLRFSTMSFVFAGIAVCVIGFLTSLFLLLWFLPRATVTFVLKTERLEREAKMKVDPDVTEVQTDTQTIPGERRVVQEKERGSVKTTGKTTVGEKATGAIALFNKSPVVRRLSGGTELTAQGSGLSFVLKDDVTIASQSSTVDSQERTISTPGSVDVTIEALNIGVEGNLAVSTEFSVAGFSLDVLKAKAKGALTGGASHEVASVTLEDQEKLRGTILASIIRRAQEKLRADLPADAVFVDKAVQTTILSMTNDFDVGEEAGELGGLADVEVAAVVYRKSDLDTLLARSVQDAVPAGFELVPEETQTQIDVETVENNGSMILRVFFETHLLPHIDKKAVVDRIAGKRSRDALDVLKREPNVLDVSIDLWPKFPDWIATLPRREDRITIERKR
ncbi:MAG: hypothetical protein Q8R11_02060 [bacterium]|nr:hypothetical protein [bacterium]